MAVFIDLAYSPLNSAKLSCSSEVTLFLVDVDENLFSCRVFLVLVIFKNYTPITIWNNQKNAGFEIWNSQLVKPDYQWG
jgi:hypothetical protein